MQPGNFVNNSLQISDDVDWVKGKHHFSFGADWIHNQLNTSSGNNANVLFTFNSQFTGDVLGDFLLGRLSDYTQNSYSQTYFRQNYIELYGQDDIHLTSRLNVHVGLRWEPFSPEVDTANRGASFSPDAFSAGTTSSVFTRAPAGLSFVGDSGIPKGFTNRRLNIFEPPVGFAFDPSGNGKQSIRASYSIGYDNPETYPRGRTDKSLPNLYGRRTVSANKNTGVSRGRCVRRHPAQPQANLHAAMGFELPETSS